MNMSRNIFDVVVIGAGPGGYVAAIRSAQLGLKTAIIEKEHMGGICLNWGCIPTKAMLRSAEIFHLMHRANEFGLRAEKISFDLQAVIKRSRGISNQLNQGVTHLLKKNKVKSFIGEATILDRGKVKVLKDEKSEELLTKNIVIASGARARELPGLEADGEIVWTYKHALTPTRMPKKLLVVGSGAIGIEFASFYNTLGADTTIIELVDRILPAEDAEVASFAHKQFLKQGMKILTQTSIKKIELKNNLANFQMENAGKVLTEQFDTVISAVGIVGNIEGLGLENISIKTEKSHIKTDINCNVGIEGIYAIGDVAGAPWLAHKASHEGVMVAELIAGKEVHTVDPSSIAGCTYCNPQIASVGLTEEEAQKKGLNIKIGRFPFIGNGKAIALGEQEGLIKTIFDFETGELLGAHMVGAEVTELIQGYVLGQKLETTEEDLISTVFPHPTLSEMMHESVLDAYDRAIHI
jgi:dihydrolipoamide dehydrogenase